MRFVKIEELLEEQFFCELELNGQVKDLTLLRTHYRQEIEITCRVRAFPEAKIKWLFGQKDLEKMFTYENKLFTTSDAKEYNSSEHMLTIDSKLRISYSGHIGKVNISCLAFYLGFVDSHENDASKPQRLFKSIQFNINSDDDQIDAPADNDGEYVLNSTVLMMREAVATSQYERPFIYYILMAVCILFTLMVILFATVCMIRHVKKNKKKERVSGLFLKFGI